jgi:putative nucleotidyltransferase with HDIG domain
MTFLFEQVLVSNDALDFQNGRDLLEYLKSLHRHLAETCEATIQGWILALELHDGESRSHAFRVTEMAEKLALKLDISESDVVHIRHGALLHDIGKLGVPGSILKKSGPLTDDEWQIMKKHPVFAYELLAPIKFLQPALDIPYYHHEKWDGSGYPNGLKRDHIPLAARIFAVVDVWDALRSNRPYRTQTWSERKIISHIRQQSGRHFDPHISEIFIRLLEESHRDPCLSN